MREMSISTVFPSHSMAAQTAVKCIRTFAMSDMKVTGCSRSPSWTCFSDPCWRRFADSYANTLKGARQPQEPTSSDVREAVRVVCE